MIINIKEIAEALNGSCESLDDVLEDYGFDIDDMTQPQFEELDAITVQCEICNWWYDTAKVSVDSICSDCLES